MKYSTPVIILLVCLFVYGCTEDDTAIVSNSKYCAGDEFAETIVESQYFEIELDDDQIIEGKNGTRIVFLEGSLIDGNGNTVSSDITVGLAEAFSLTDMMLSNLTTTSGKSFLETDGMIYLNLTSNGQQLHIDPKNPLYIEIPTANRIAGMEIYSGVRDAQGNIDWVDPEPIQNYLIPIDIELLDYLPKGFKTEVSDGLPFRSHQVASQELADSLYFSLSVADGSELTNGFGETEFNERYDTEDVLADSIPYQGGDDERDDCGVDPASIKVIRTDQFQNTFIATREFEVRLQSIFESCENDVLEIYITNLGSDLWISDSIAAELTSKENIRQEFLEYSNERLTNVEDGVKYAEVLKNHFESELKKVEEDLNLLFRKMTVALEKENMIAEKIAKEYKSLLGEREKFRMESYGFRQSRTGWLNVDIGNAPKKWGPHKLELIASRGETYDRIHSYLIFKSMKSLFRLQSEDNIHFYAGSVQSNEMLMPKNSDASCITIAYINGKAFIGIEDFTTSTTESISTTLAATSEQEIDVILSKYESFEQENSIQKDMEYMVQFDAEKRRQKKLQKEGDFILGLSDFVFSCCDAEGAALFEANCMPCHTTSEYTTNYCERLGHISYEHEKEWFVLWTRNAQEFRESGNEKAIRILSKYEPMLGRHAPSSLSSQEISSIYEYLDGFEYE